MTRTLSSDGTQLFWTERGNPDGEPLLFISGQAMSHRGWLNIVDQFSQFRILVSDHRGIGQSEPGTVEPYTTVMFADDCAAVLRAAGVESAHIYGHSMGGRIAQQLALQHPEMVQKLVLGATTPGESQGALRSREATRDLFSGRWRRLAPHFFSEAFVLNNEAQVRAFFATDASPETLRQHYLASKTHDTWDQLGNIRAETLVVHGERDDLTPVENAYLMAEGIPGAATLIIEQGLHGYFLERADVNAETVKFLEL